MTQFCETHQKKITYFRTAAIFYQKKRKPQHSNSFLFEGSYSYEKAFRLLVVFLLFPVRSPYETAKLQTRFLPFLQISQRMSFLVFARFWRRYLFNREPLVYIGNISLSAGNCLFAHSENHTFLIPLAYTFLGFCLPKILLIFLFGV